MVCYVIICSILNHILDFGYSGERIYFGFIEERYKKILKLPNIFTTYLSDIQIFTLNNTNTEEITSTVVSLPLDFPKPRPDPSSPCGNF